MSETDLSSRREFLAAGVKTAAGAAVLSALPSNSAATGRLRFGLTTYELGKDWDLDAIFRNLNMAKVHGVELKTVITNRDGTPLRYPHGVELDLPARQRAEVKRRFADSPVELVSLATSEHFPYSDGAKDWGALATVDGIRIYQEKYGRAPDNGESRTKATIEAVKEYLKLSKDVGSKFVRVLPNNWLPDFPHEKALDMIAEDLNEVASVAQDLGQQIALEAHSAPGSLENMRYVMDRVKYKCIGIRLNSEARNAVDPGFDEQFQYVKNVLSPTMHIHDLKDPKYPYQLVVNTLTKAGWDGWAFLEVGANFPDRVAVLKENREIWDKMVANAANA
jgi:sugar phosphate isomerase/epimerase